MNIFNDETYNSEVLECPYCNFIHKDAWELSGEDGEIYCEKCDKTFLWARHINISYTGKKIKNDSK